jgi:phosphoglycerate dehydrogenase-like enzyme
MRKGRANLLVGETVLRREDFDPLTDYATIYWLEDMSAEEERRVLPSIDCIYSHGWPDSLNPTKLSTMKNLRLLQTENAGVNWMRFNLLDESVIICSNAGAYSEEVAEFAISLMQPDAGGR